MNEICVFGNSFDSHRRGVVVKKTEIATSNGKSDAAEELNQSDLSVTGPIRSLKTQMQSKQNPLERDRRRKDNFLHPAPSWLKKRSKRKTKTFSTLR